MKRLGIIGNFRTDHTAEQDWRVAFESAGWEVVPYQANRMSARQVLGAAKYCDVLLWVTMGQGWPEELAVEASKHCRTIGWRPDRYFGRSGIGTWWRDPLFRCEVVVTTDGYPHDWGQYGINHEFVPQAVSARWVEGTGRVRQGLAADVAFIGQMVTYPQPDWKPVRMELRDTLTNLCQRQGWRWRNFGGDHKRVERGRRMSDLYRSCTVTVGDSMLYWGRDDRYWSNRVPEALGRGGVLVFPRVDCLAELTDGMLPMFDLGDMVQLEDTVAELMADRARCDKLRRWGKLWAADHTYEKTVPVLEGLL